MGKYFPASLMDALWEKIKSYVDQKTAAGLFTLQLDPETGDLYAVYPDGTIPPNFEYDSATGNLYYVTDD